MRLFLNRIAIALVALSLAGCATLPGPLGDAVRVLTTTITNPVGDTDIYRVRNAYAATLELAVEYRRYCWSQPYAVLMADPVAKPVCERRRAVVRAFQRARGNASAALAAAEIFIMENPTLSAATAVSAAWKAVADFKSAVPTK